MVVQGGIQNATGIHGMGKEIPGILEEVGCGPASLVLGGKVGDVHSDMLHF